MGFAGKFGSVYITAADTLVDLTDTTVATGNVRTVNIRACNQLTQAVTIKIAVYTAGGAVGNKDYIVFNGSIPAGGRSEETGIVVGAGEKIQVSASAAGVSFRAHGFEEGV